MSVLETYMSWVNSVLSEVGSSTHSVQDVRQGKLLCQLVDVLSPKANLEKKTQEYEDDNPVAYIRAVLDHMTSHGIKIRFPPEDITNNEIKSMLDVLWLLILNYGIHDIDAPVQERSVGNAKRDLLLWCQTQLSINLDPKASLTSNLNNKRALVTLLERASGCVKQNQEATTEYVQTLLDSLQDKYNIQKTILKAADIADGNQDEHSLMIYLSLLRRRISLSSDKRHRSQSEGRSRLLQSTEELNRQRSSSVNTDSCRGKFQSLPEQQKNDGNETSDWSSNGSLTSTRDHTLTNRNNDREEILHKFISDSVQRNTHTDYSNVTDRLLSTQSNTESANLNQSSCDLEKKVNSPTTLNEMGQSLIPQQLQATAQLPRVNVNSNENSPLNELFQKQSISNGSDNILGNLSNKNLSRENSNLFERKEIRIIRPNDYIDQWEDTMDRLSGSFPRVTTKPPLISTINLSHLRSRSYDQQNPSNHIQTTIHSTSRSRSTDNTTAQIELDKSRVSYNTEEDFLKNSQEPTHSTIKNDHIVNILSTLPDDLQDEALDASQFLMHANATEIQSFINSLKQVKETEQREVFVEHNTSKSINQTNEDDERMVQRSSSPSPKRILKYTDRSRFKPKEPMSKHVHENTNEIIDLQRKNRERKVLENRDDKYDSPQTELKQTQPVNYDVVKTDSRHLASSRLEHLKPKDIRSISLASFSSFSDQYYDENQNIKPEPRFRFVAQTNYNLNPVRIESSYNRGSGRVPRREAWESRQRRTEKIVSDIPAAQTKFIDVLCREIDVLKTRIWSMEEEENSRYLSELKSSSLNRRFANPNAFLDSSESFRDDRSMSCPLLNYNYQTGGFFENHRNKLIQNKTLTTKDRPIRLYHPDRIRLKAENSDKLYSSQNISTDEIEDLISHRTLDPHKQEKWKQLISIRQLNDTQVIELKQALASAIVENDILQSKLNNTRNDIHDKLRHTNEVLDDCRNHLASAQAENMELRTRLKEEKSRSEQLESRIQDLQDNVTQVKVDRQHAENKLEQTNAWLDRSRTELKPGIDAIKAENNKLISRLAKAENSNDLLQEELCRVKMTQAKSMNTIDELRQCLTKVRQEREDVYLEVQELRRNIHSKRLNTTQTDERILRSNKSYETDKVEKRNDQSNIDSDDGIYSAESLISMDSQLTSVFGTATKDRGGCSQRMVPVSTSRSPGGENSSELCGSSREIYPHRANYYNRTRSASPPSRAYIKQREYNKRNDDRLENEIEKYLHRERQNLQNASKLGSVADRSMHDNSQHRLSLEERSWDHKHKSYPDTGQGYTQEYSFRRRSRSSGSCERNGRRQVKGDSHPGSQHSSRSPENLPRRSHSPPTKLPPERNDRRVPKNSTKRQNRQQVIGQEMDRTSYYGFNFEYDVTSLDRMSSRHKKSWKGKFR